MRLSVSGFVIGGFAWSLSEYLIHRFVGHRPKRPHPSGLLSQLTPAGWASEFNREHLAHHATTSYFGPTSRKLLAASVALPSFIATLTPIFGMRRAASVTLGFGVAYAAYEVVHRRVHTHPPRGPYGRWVRRHHLLHHHKTPRQNHGVTSPLWDYLFATHLPAERIRIPQHAAPPWMLNDQGELKPEFHSDYELTRRTVADPTIPSQDGRKE